jgi:hypothetical protein
MGKINDKELLCIVDLLFPYSTIMGVFMDITQKTALERAMKDQLQDNQRFFGIEQEELRKRYKIIEQNQTRIFKLFQDSLIGVVRVDGESTLQENVAFLRETAEDFLSQKKNI